jgi:hypothetical protein
MAKLITCKKIQQETRYELTLSLSRTELKLLWHRLNIADIAFRQAYEKNAPNSFPNYNRLTRSDAVEAKYESTSSIWAVIDQILRGED